MPRSFARPQRDRGVSVKLDEIFEMEFVDNEGRGLKATRRVNGRISFSSFGPRPQDGDIWKVRIPSDKRHQNDSGSVYFLELVERVSTRAKRKAAEEAESDARQVLRDKHNALKSSVQNWLDSFDQWDVSEHSFELEGVSMMLRPKVEKFAAQADGLVITIIPEVEYYENMSRFEKIEIVVEWGELQVERVYLREAGRWNQVSVTIATEYGKFDAVFFAPFAGEVRFIGWEREDAKLNARMTINLNGVSTEVTVLVMDFKVDSGKGEVRQFVSDYSRKDEQRIEHYLPEVAPQEHIDWLQAMKTEHEARGEQMQVAGLLAIGNSTVSYKLKELFDELGYGGIGWSPWGKNGNHVIHLSLRPMVAELPDIELAPAEMKDGAPAHAWQAITWTNGFEPPVADVIEALASETTEKVEELDLQDWLAGLGEDAKVVCQIICEEQETGGDAYIFHAVVQAPHTVRIYRKYTFGAYGWGSQSPIEVRTEDREYIFERIATGNEKFEGDSELEVYYRRSGKRSRWLALWSAPETKTEETTRKVTEIRSLIEFASQYQVILTGWRYSDNDNPVVLVNYGDETWQVREFHREGYNVMKRKGFGSNKVVVYGDPSVRGIGKALTAYRDEYGWNVEADDNWQETAGTGILSLFPQDLVQKLGEVRNDQEII